MAPPMTNEPRTSDVEAACSGQIGMAETRDNGYVYDRLLKKKMAHPGYGADAGSVDT